MDKFCKEVILAEFLIDGKIKERHILGSKPDSLQCLFLSFRGSIASNSFWTGNAQNLWSLTVLGGVRKELRRNFASPAGWKLREERGSTTASLGVWRSSDKIGRNQYVARKRHSVSGVTIDSVASKDLKSTYFLETGRYH